MKVIEGMKNALLLLESHGYVQGGDIVAEGIHDDLANAIMLVAHHPEVANLELPMPWEGVPGRPEYSPRVIALAQRYAAERFDGARLVDLTTKQREALLLEAFKVSE